MQRFKKNKAVIVTGAARETGRACVLAFAREGADILIVMPVHAAATNLRRQVIELAIAGFQPGCIAKTSRW